MDIANWRAMMVTCAAPASAILEICLVNVTVTSQHLDDLGMLLKASDGIESLKLEYLEFSGDQDTFISSLKALIASSPGLRYLSLKGNSLSDKFISECRIELRNHASLEALNISDNVVSDEGITQLFEILPLAISLSTLSVKNNVVSINSILSGLDSLLSGTPVTPELEGELKGIVKLVNDRNKAIKDANKKRKKDGLEEFPDVVSPMAKIVKADTAVLYNRSLVYLDFSSSSGISDDKAQELAEKLQVTAAAVPPLDQGTQSALTVVLRGATCALKDALTGANLCGLVSFVW
eukprot:CAMPEP_0185035270 /NCGR_PEP_ID=MMETSP1103-20130426/26342_1 /TAXON_ID=36769 /ORGANISM="Paraphysomonas bandaiensis, Strain Caron Lab Isolate" /LENGTH=292 /DNA_ID=CAMNT_0027572275 /DNA_START=283 /DNA_END=1161 /DNA_ORIENTATION=+